MLISAIKPFVSVASGSFALLATEQVKTANAIKTIKPHFIRIFTTPLSLINSSFLVSYQFNEKRKTSSLLSPAPGNFAGVRVRGGRCECKVVLPGLYKF
ncbi:MAG TPA: hypothetical protein DCG57_09755 [Candidatus Riflebacteria bacterium]|nr:hypothetical protein [Candidatus Riflebacteria bacterium]